jgi:hypothetical protein
VCCRRILIQNMLCACYRDEVSSLQGGRALAVEVMKTNAVLDLQKLAGSFRDIKNSQS